ncbi:MAG: hypothetical protein RBR68_12865 [Tenuifilaceae bacterium]|nr:hypothetical protein [Tenuifilaceae bacterium]
MEYSKSSLERIRKSRSGGKKYLPPLNSKVEYRIENELRRLWIYPQNSNRPVFNDEKKKTTGHNTGYIKCRRAG